MNHEKLQSFESPRIKELCVLYAQNTNKQRGTIKKW